MISIFQMHRDDVLKSVDSKWQSQVVGSLGPSDFQGHAFVLNAKLSFPADTDIGQVIFTNLAWPELSIFNFLSQLSTFPGTIVSTGH